MTGVLDFVRRDIYHFYIAHLDSVKISSMAQWQRAGPITPRSLDRNKLLLVTLDTVNSFC